MINKKIVFLLVALCSASPAAFASHSSGSVFETSTGQEDDRYASLVERFPSKFSALDFKLLKVMKEMYKDLSPEQAAVQDFTHNPLLETTVKTWKDLFVTHGAGKTAFLDAEITERLENSRLTLEWVSLLPMRFAAAISDVPTQEEINLYNWAFYGPNACHESFFDQTIYTSHDAFKELMIKENLPSQICFRPKGKSQSVVIPFIGMAQLKLHEMVLMNLDHIFPVGIPLTPATSEVHGIKTPTAFGFAVHDDLHINDAHNASLQALDNLPDSLRAETSAAHILRQKHDLITNVLKFVFYQTLENAGMNLSDKSVRETVLALFFGVHERGAWPNTLYRAETLEDIIDAFVSFTLQQESNRLSGLSIRDGEEDARHDRLHTSPLDGSTQLEASAIESIFYPEGLSKSFDNTQELKNIFEDLLRQRKKTQTLLKDHNVIKFMSETRNDDSTHIFQTKTHDFTLHYRLNDAKGVRSLLSYAGIKLPSVTVESLAGLEHDAASNQALAYLNTIAGHASDIVLNFGRQAKALLQTPEVENLRTQNDRITWQGLSGDARQIIRPFLLMSPDPFENIVILSALKDFSLDKIETLASVFPIFFSQDISFTVQTATFEALKELSTEQINMIAAHALVLMPESISHPTRTTLLTFFKDLSAPQIEAIALCQDVFMNKALDALSIMSNLSAVQSLTPENIHGVAKIVREKVITQNKTVTSVFINLAINTPELLDIALNEEI